MSSTRTPPKLVFGGGPLGPDSKFPYFPDEASIAEVYRLLEAGGIDTIDTARMYGVSEEWIGKTGGGKRFVIDTKTPGGLNPGDSTSVNIPVHARESVERLGVDQIDVFYIHAPDASVPLEDQLKGIHTAYIEGRFKRFGLSNYVAADVQRVYDICKEKGYLLPTVYQSNYNAVSRKNEAVYSPIAGGLLTKTSAQLRAGVDAGRFSKGDGLEPVYWPLYDKPSYYTALDLWAEAAKETGCSGAELGYRWVAYDSVVDGRYGDAVIFGASKLAQITPTIEWLKRGSVGEKAKAKIDEIWKLVEHEAPVDTYNR
ncbi:aldehyde reductase [Mycena filopes]|nr:aldehyde reductase [Mycena filopes]